MIGVVDCERIGGDAISERQLLLDNVDKNANFKN